MVLYILTCSHQPAQNLLHSQSNCHHSSPNFMTMAHNTVQLAQRIQLFWLLLCAAYPPRYPRQQHHTFTLANILGNSCVLPCCSRLSIWERPAAATHLQIIKLLFGENWNKKINSTNELDRSGVVQSLLMQPSQHARRADVVPNHGWARVDLRSYARFCSARCTTGGWRATNTLK